MRPSALPLVAGVLFAVGCQKTETTRTVAAPAPAVLAAAPPAPAAPRAAPQPAAPAAPAADTYAARTKQLLEAAEKGRVSQVQELLQKGANVNDKDDDGQTALHKAAARGHKSALIALLALGADMGEKDGKGRTPLMTAAEAGNAEIVRLLVTPGTVAALAGDVLKSGAPGAKLPAGLDAMVGPGGLLSKRVGAATDQTDPAGRTALMLAAAGGHADCVKALGADHERTLRPDKKGRNALMLAAAGGHTEAVGALLHGFWVGKLTLADLQRADADGKTALDLAEAGGHKSVIRSLCGELAEKAAFEGDLPMVQKALEKCPDLPARQVMNRAAAGGALTVVRHLMGQHKDKSAEEKLRMMGAKPLPDTTANTALEAALGANQGDVVTALLDPDWWKDKAALSAFIRFKPSNGFSILNDYNRGQKPELMRLIEARLKQVEAAK